MDKKLWERFLNKIIDLARHSRLNKEAVGKITSIVLPLFLFRVLTFYEEIENMNSKQINKAVKYNLQNAED